MDNDKELALRQSKDMENVLTQHYPLLFASRKTIEAVRNERLRKLLAHAKTFSPWYKKSLAHIDVDGFTEERLHEIPPINKEILMSHWDDIVTHRNLSLQLVEKHLAAMKDNQDLLYLHQRYHALSTSGSSGKRGVFVYDWDEWNQYYIFLIRLARYKRQRFPHLYPSCRKIKIAQVIVTNAVYAMYSLSKTYHFHLFEKFYFPVTLPVADITAGLNQTQPDVIQTTPSILYALCREAERKQLLIKPTVITVSAEPFYRPIRELVQKTWPGVNLFNIYGASEGISAVNCRANRLEMHLNDDACIIQPVDEHDTPTAKGILPQKMYLTNLYNYTLPLIRYEFGDRLLFLDKTCDCGMNHQLIAEPQGRPEFDFVYPGSVFVHHLVFVTPLLLEKNIKEYQVLQTREGALIKILSTGEVNKNRLKNDITDNLRKLGLPQPEIDFLEVTHFSYPASGKLRRFIKLN